MSISRVVIAAGIGLLEAGQAGAQEPVTGASKWELRSTTGGMMPTGDQRQVLENAQLSGAQLAWAVHPAVAITGSFSWARSRDLLTTSTPKVDVFTSDVGVELCPKVWRTEQGTTFRSFASTGLGARSYNYRKLDVDATHNLAGYVGAGGEVGFGRIGLRLEVRDYVAGFKPLTGVGSAETRNDVVIMGGVRFNRRRS